MKAPYEELYEIVFCGSNARPNRDALLFIPDDAADTVAWVVDNHPSLTDRERDCMKRKWIANETLYEIGKTHGVTRERVRQIIMRGARKMMNGKLSLYRLVLEHGIGMYQEVLDDYNCFREEEKERLLQIIEENDKEMQRLRIRAEESTVTAEEITQKPICECDFSVRTHNCLLRARVDTVGKLMVLNAEQLIHIRNMGKKSVVEIQRWFKLNNINAACLDGEIA